MGARSVAAPYPFEIANFTPKTDMPISRTLFPY
ncbi:MAG: hypothetical protein BWX99_01476 [Deltaproteobacteria bacterium ADurb.Bin151]|nr:MAG: hypothetical protein BWX99_01476 [Deltaproteobacteria bacterium ADurb.Bin151]